MKPKLELAVLVFAVALAVSATAGRLSRVEHDMSTPDAGTWNGRPAPVVESIADEPPQADEAPRADDAAAETPPPAYDGSTPMSSVALARVDEAARSDDWRAIDAASAAAVESGAAR